MAKELNSGQQAAAKGFLEFLFKPEKELIISGPGGVGKTHLVTHMIDEIMPQYHQMCTMMGMESNYDEVVITATTNPAANVLGSATGRPTSTIHSHMNLKVVDDWSKGTSSIQRTKSWKIHYNQIIFVDECSYIDTPLRNYINEGTMNSKIVYVGDHCQLAPVKEKISPIYLDNLPFFELTEQMRTNNPDLQAMNNQLRQTVETGEFKPIKIVPGVIDWFTEEDMQKAIEMNFAQTSTEHRIMAYTNERVNMYNEFIREFRGISGPPQQGEVYVNNSAIQLSSCMLPTEAELTIVKIHEQVKIPIEGDVDLDVLIVDAATDYGMFYDLKIPMDKIHLTQLIKWYSRQKNWERYFYLKNTFPELRPRDAQTVHKAQGKTYEVSYIDLEDISRCHNPDTAARLLYVAFSRARTRVVLYGELAPKYGSLIK